MKTHRVLAVLFLVFASVACAGDKWPTVRGTSGSKHFSDTKSAAITTTISSTRGDVLYSLECYSGEYGDDQGFNYSGLFHCRLASKKPTDTLPSLLFENPHPSSDWEGRARFLLGEVLGECAKVSDWGAVRHFRLRGMDIHLSITEVSIDEHGPGSQVKSFTFSYDIRHDPSAETSLAAPSTVPEPTWFGSDKACWPKKH